MSRAGDDLRKDFKRMRKHSKRMFRNFFESRRNDRNDCEDNFRGPGPGPGPHWGWPPRPGYPPFSPFKHPITLLFYPKYIVGCLIIITLILCGVGFYGFVIIILLMLLFIFI